jgi:hypothetical protein
MRRAAIVSLLILLVAAPARADDDPSSGKLVLAGAAMAVPTYMLGVIWHEGTHALAARAFGAEILELRLYPSVYQGRFYFGLTRWSSTLTCPEKAFTWIAPKLTDVLLLGGYGLLLATDALPENDYGALAFTVVATGAWVDLVKDVFTLNPGNDLMKVHALYGHTREGQRLPWRILQASVSLAGAYLLYRGYRDLFDDEDAAAPRALVFQLASGTF